MQVEIDVMCMHTSFASSVLEIWLPFKNSQISLSRHGHQPWTSKNLIIWNRLKKFMQVGTDVECMHTNFGGRDPSSFGDKNCLWLIKVEKFNRSESAQKIHASRDSCHMHAHQFWWAWLVFFQRYGYLSKTAKFPFRDMDYSPWSSKNLIDQNQLKKFMQVGTDVECMHTDFGGRDPSGFGDKISLWLINGEKFSHSELAQKILLENYKFKCATNFSNISEWNKNTNFNTR